METRRDVFQAIADPTRRQIINMIASKSLHLNAIAEGFDVSRQAISLHIKILNECGLIEIRQQGRERYCYVQPKVLDEVDDWLADFRRTIDNRFDRLDTLLVTMKSKDKTKQKKK